MAEQGKVVELGRAAFGEGDHVVHLEPGPHVAIGDDTDAVPLDEGGAERPVDRAPEV